MFRRDSGSRRVHSLGICLFEAFLSMPQFLTTRQRDTRQQPKTRKDHDPIEKMSAKDETQPCTVTTYACDAHHISCPGVLRTKYKFWNPVVIAMLQRRNKLQRSKQLEMDGNNQMSHTQFSGSTDIVTPPKAWHAFYTRIRDSKPIQGKRLQAMSNRDHIYTTPAWKP